MASNPDSGQPEFSVAQFFEDGTWEYVRRFVDASEAVTAALHYTDNVACKMGITKRVIITDGFDRCVFEWRHGEGVMWPTPEPRREAERLAAGEHVGL